jgi:hypothetical protein
MQGQWLITPPAKGPQLIKARDMIQVRMRVNDRINFPNALTQSLHAKVRPRIHQHRRAARTHQGR